MTNNSPGILSITLLDSSGNPVEGEVVKFSVDDSTIAALAVASALTDVNGQASVRMDAGTVAGAASVTITATVSGVDVIETVNVESSLVSTEVVTAGSLNLELQDGSGAVISRISESQSGVLVATLSEVTTTTTTTTTATGTTTDAVTASQIVSGSVVTFSVDDGSFSTFDPVSAKALTDAAGQATMALNASALAGADDVTAIATLAGKTVTGTTAFEAVFTTVLGSVNGTNFTDGQLSSSLPGNGQLSAGGTFTVSATVADSAANNAVYDVPVEVSFTSGCAVQLYDHDANAATADEPKAVIDSPVATVNGTATATYRANGCTGTDTITARIANGATATTAVDVASASVGSIEFVSATPQWIAIKGTGDADRPETSTLKFLVKNSLGNPVAGETISFSLTSQFGGLSLSPVSAQAVSDADGFVQIVVNSGTVSGPVSVYASHTTGSGVIFTHSNELVISTGLPDSDSMSLSLETINTETWNHDGVVVKATVRAADHFNNPVPDGTVFYFTTEGGSIGAQCQSENNSGGCTVDWESQAPRPTDGRVTILVRAVGEESFVDASGNGFFDDAEMASVDDLAEAFRDDDESGSYSAGDQLFGFNNDSQWDLADGFYNGALCTDAAIILGHCSSLIEVTDSIVLVMSSSSLNITPDAGDLNGSGDFIVPIDGNKTLNLVIADVNGNAPAEGTNITVATSEGTITFGGSATVGSQRSAFNHPVVIEGGADAATGTITITATSPDGTVTSLPLTIKIQ
ncbi:MAG: hypothetical protein ACPGF7_12405 [Pontibacterium sp.]